MMFKRSGNKATGYGVDEGIHLIGSERLQGGGAVETHTAMLLWVRMWSCDDVSTILLIALIYLC